MLAKCGLKSVVVLLATLAASSQSQAKDLARLAELLTPVYVAQNFNAICSARNPEFSVTTRGSIGPMPAYTQHIKEEVIFGLPPTQARFVMVGAADAAKSVALAKLREFGPPARVDEQRLGQWCEGAARRLIIEIMSRHDTKHGAHIEAIARAKAD